MGKVDFKELEKKLAKSVYTVDDIIKMNASDRNVRMYLPEIAKLFNSITISAFLTQIKWRWERNNNRPFYKYIAPCAEARFGDTWVEELAITKAIFRSIKDKVCTKVLNAHQARELLANGTKINHLVVYYTDSSNMSYWYFNAKLFIALKTEALILFPNYKTEEEEKKISLKPEVRKSQTRVANLAPPLKDITDNRDLKEKENLIKEKENEEEDEFFNSPPVEVSPEVEKEREENRKKALKQKTIPSFVQKGSKKMSLDFHVKPSIIAEVVETRGWSEEFVKAIALKYETYYKNSAAGIKWKVLSWDIEFVDSWIPYQLEKGFIEPKGELKKDANTERQERLRQLAGRSVFDEIGTTDFAEIGAKIRQRHYGNNGDGYNS